MEIKLLHAVLHNGHRVEAGEVGDIDPEVAASLIASGAAVAVEEAAPEPQPRDGQLLDGPAPQVGGIEAKTEPAPEPKPVENDKKAAKAEGK